MTATLVFRWLHGGEDHPAEPVTLQRWFQWPGPIRHVLNIVWSFFPPRTGSGFRGDTEGHRTILNGEIPQHTTRQPREDQIPVAGLPLFTARVLRVHTSPQLECNTLVTGNIGNVEADAL